jgi:REP element-mobilizing transposase RayT
MLANPAFDTLPMMREGHAPRGADLRKGRFSETGRIYLVTAVTHERAALFAEFHAARVLIHEMRATDSAGHTQTLAFVIMPDHFHWLFQLTTDELSAVVQRVKSRAAIRLNQMMDSQGCRIWQRGFHDHALRCEEDMRAVARYVIANPVRAGLARSARDYSHWDAAWLDA